MRYPIYGRTPASALVTVYEKGTTNPVVIYSSEISLVPVVNSQVQASVSGEVVFYVDGDLYPVPFYFDLKITKAGFTDKWLYNVWTFFDATNMTSGGTGVPEYTFGYMQGRLATFFSLDLEDSQVLDVVKECIQTGYEKVVSITNMHTKEKELSISTIANQREYDVPGLGIPTFLAYKSTRLKYLPLDTFREKYFNFDADTAWDDGDPVNYSLQGFDANARKVVLIAPTPKETGLVVPILCSQVPPILVNDNDYPLVPQDWAWLVIERGKVERARFEGNIESYQIQAQEFVAYMKQMIKRSFPATPEPETGFVVPTERSAYNSWRGRRQ